MDIMTPGNTRNALTKVHAEDFKDSWNDVPIFGFIVASLGLPGILAWGMVLITFLQVCMFVRMYLDMEASLNGRDPHTWSGTQIRAVCSDLMIIAGGSSLIPLETFFRTLCGVPSYDRAGSYFARCLETVFQTWFTTSALVFTWGDSFDVAAPLLVSISTSYVAAVMGAVDMCFLLSSAFQLRGSAFRARVAAGLVAFQVLGFAAITARIIGIFVCDNSHDLQLSRFRCAP